MSDTKPNASVSSEIDFEKYYGNEPRGKKVKITIEVPIISGLQETEKRFDTTVEKALKKYFQPLADELSNLIAEALLDHRPFLCVERLRGYIEQTLNELKKNRKKIEETKLSKREGESGSGFLH